MSLPPAYSNEIATLNREILKAQPSDILQFCANFFQRRLESQRTEFLLTKRGGGMADKTFASANPFGNGAAGFGGSTQSGMHSVAEEEDENEIGSPTDAAYKSKEADFSSGGGFGGFGSGGGLFSGPFGGQSIQDSSPPSSFPPNYAAGRRVSVSAESMNPNADGDDWKPPNHPKSNEQLGRLRSAVAGNFLFSHLDDEQFRTVLGALVEKPVPSKSIKVISQGEDGDYFYVVEKGNFDIYINSAGHVEPGPEGMGNKVSSIGPGGSFGELALMYNAPRAATVVSTEPSTLWQLDRMTFRRILMDSAFQRRRMYESFLEEVPLLSNLKPYERSKIADALDTVKFPPGSSIINEGDAGDAFYILETGEAEAFKRGVDGPVKHYKRGDFFGELALLEDKPRAASVVSKTDVKVAKLGRDGFQRLLGPVENIMREEKYDDRVDPLAHS